MNEPVPDGDRGFASGCGTSLPQDKMDGFAGSLGERLRAARSGGRDGTAREGRGEPDSGRQPALLSWGRGPGTRTCGRAGSRRGQRRAAGSASGSWSRGDAELSAQRHPLCGGRGGKRVGREGERERGRGCQREIWSASNHLLRELRLHLPPLFFPRRGLALPRSYLLGLVWLVLFNAILILLRVRRDPGRPEPGETASFPLLPVRAGSGAAFSGHRSAWSAGEQPLLGARRAALRPNPKHLSLIRLSAPGELTACALFGFAKTKANFHHVV